VERLKQELAARQGELDAARSGGTSPAAAALPAPDPLAAIQAPVGTLWQLIAGFALVIGLACGFWLGYATLARRVKNKFGGIKVY
jgi:hypothetical protein